MDALVKCYSFFAPSASANKRCNIICKVSKARKESSAGDEIPMFLVKRALRIFVAIFIFC